MESSLPSSAKRQLDRFCRQYLQIDPRPDYPSDEFLRQESFQARIYSRLFQDGALAYSPPPRYQLKVLKELTRRIEASIQDWDQEGISDDLMNTLAPLLSTPIPSETTAAQTKSYVTYTLSALPPYPSQNPDQDSDQPQGQISDLNQDQSQSQFLRQSTPLEPRLPTITLLETPNLILAAGITGFRTWEAALHLGHYLCHNPSIINSKSILELGAGTGYISILCNLYLGASHVLATDGSDSVLEGLATNFYLNGLQDNPRIQARELRWGYALDGGEEGAWNGGRKVDVVLGADLTYDAAKVPALVGTLGEVWEGNGSVTGIFAAAVRNEETFEVFLVACGRAGWKVELVEFGIGKRERQEGPFCDDMVPIRLCVLTKE